MMIFSALFGIFRQRGFVRVLAEDRALTGLVGSALLVSLLGCLTYGFAMGIGYGVDTALKDAIKAGITALLTLVLTFPIFCLAYRLFGREEKLSHIGVVPLTFVATTSIMLSATAPVVFMLSLLVGTGPGNVYIHIFIVNLAILVGLYLSGALIYHSFTKDRDQLIIPNILSYLMLTAILIVLILFLSPFLARSDTFSEGTDLLRDRLGIGVSEKVSSGLASASEAIHVQYEFEATNQHGDLERDYTINRVGEDYLVEIHLHAIPGETTLRDRHIWILNDQIFTDFADGQVSRATPNTVEKILWPALPPQVFLLPDEFSTARWLGLEAGGVYTATGVTPSNLRTVLSFHPDTMRLISFTLGHVDQDLNAEIRIQDLRRAYLQQSDIADSLHQALVLGSVDRTDAALQDFVQRPAFFVVRYPRTWRAGRWEPDQHRVSFMASCPTSKGCPELTVTLYDLDEEKSADQYARDLSTGLSSLPAYYDVRSGSRVLDGAQVGVSEYLFDQAVEGEIVTTRHIEYIFVGSEFRYHLDFSAPADLFTAYQDLFLRMALAFTYLRNP